MKITVLFTKEKSIIKYNGSNDSIDWRVDFDKHISGISRVDNYVFMSTQFNSSCIYNKQLFLPTSHLELRHHLSSLTPKL